MTNAYVEREYILASWKRVSQFLLVFLVHHIFFSHNEKQISINYISERVKEWIHGY